VTIDTAQVQLIVPTASWRVIAVAYRARVCTLCVHFRVCVGACA